MTPNLNSENTRVPITVFQAEANFIKITEATRGLVNQAIDKYTFSFYDEKMCSRCPLLEQRHSEPCDSCEGFKGTRQLGKVVNKGVAQVPYLSVPIGGIKRLSNLLENNGFTAVFKPRFGYEELKPFVPFNLIRTLLPWQEEALPVCLARKRGIV
jgi:hypothetical protein